MRRDFTISVGARQDTIQFKTIDKVGREVGKVSGRESRQEREREERGKQTKKRHFYMHDSESYPSVCSSSYLLSLPRLPLLVVLVCEGKVGGR
jgi:hypothetical protein